MLTNVVIFDIIYSRGDSMARKIERNDNYFSEPNLENSYWAGFIAADGCVCGDKIYIEISDKDESHLKKFSEAISWMGNLKFRTRGHYRFCRIQFNSKHICNDLKNNFNIVSNKTYIGIPPNLPQDLVKAFIIGYIDGDGCISLDKKNGYSYTRVTITSKSELMFNWLVSEIEKACFSKPSISGINMTLSGRRADNFLNYLIEVDIPFKLNRKWSIRGAPKRIFKENIFKIDKKRKIPLKEYASIYNRFINGETQVSIAKSYSVEKNTINRIIKRLKDSVEYVDTEEIA